MEYLSGASSRLSKESELVNSLGIAIVNRNIDLANTVVKALSELEEYRLLRVTDKVRTNLTKEEWQWFQSLLVGDNNSKFINPLDENDKQLKQELKTRIVENTQRFFVDTGRDLHTLKQKRLYREEYSSWESYCQLELGINVSTANRAIKAYLDSESIRLYLDDDIPLPKTDYVLRILTQIKDVEIRAKVWERAINENPNPSTPDIKRIYAEITNPEIKSPKPKDLEFNTGDLVSIKDAQVKWGKIVDITCGLRYKVRSGNITATYQTYQIVNLEIPLVIAANVEKLYENYLLSVSPNSFISEPHPHVKLLATTFYNFDKFDDFQITLLEELTKLCQ